MMMVYEPSPSNPILPLSDDKSSASSKSSLAPGFRFHPTDEELVSYYLKRKVKGLSLRVDAIAELDLYKKEPWELPHYSRLRSRDKEWYFFSPLDRKYSNRNRTNRATAAGYWKTTGKDRPVHHANKLVGMKKTLVFHAGRAPRGKRTNWVMHEYRMEDEDDHQHPDPNLLQASFVVCRIFEKNGTGPQNGAQYGAPFVEEEWEEEGGDFVPLREVAPDGVIMDPHYSSGEQDSGHSDDFEQKLDLGDQHENTAIGAVESEGKDIRSHSEDPTIFLDDILNLNTYDNEPGLQDGPNNNINMEEKSEIGQQSHSPSDRNDGYMELRDILDNARMDCPRSGTSFDGVLPGVDGVDHIIGSGVKYETTTLPDLDGNEFNFDIANETAIDHELRQMCTEADNIFDLQSDSLLNPVAGHYPSNQLSEDNIMFYDAPSSQPPYAAEDDITNSSDFQFSPTADLPGFDMVDDFMAYFDATDNNLQYDILDSPVKSQFVPEVEGSIYSTYEAPLKVPETNIERDASSSARFQEANNQLAVVNEVDTVAPDLRMNKSWNNSLKKRVVNMLGSISAPPAMAQGSVKGKGVVGALSAVQSSSSVHVSAGVIQIHGITVVGSAERWTLQKNGDMSFFLTYGMSSDNDNEIGKSVCFEPITKLHGGLSALLLRGGFYLFGISALILSVSYKVVMCVYNK